MIGRTHVPDGWQVARLGDVAEVNPRRPRLNVPDDTQISFLPMAAVGERLSGVIERQDRPYREVSSGYTYFEEGDVIFAKITPCLQNGKHALLGDLPNRFGFGSTEFHVVRADSQMDPRHLFRVLTQPQNIRECVNSFTGTAGQQRVQPEVLKSLPILLPPLQEQRAIAAVLDSIDDAIERTEEVIAATERLRDALLHELLTRGVPGWHSEWKEAPGIGTIPACWDVVRLGDVVEVRNGTTPSRAETNYWQDGDVPFIKTGQVNDTLIEVPDEFITSQAVASAGAVVVPRGSVLIAMIGQGKTRGMTAQLKIDAAINQNFAAVFGADGDFSLDFFFTWARQNYSHIRALGQGSNQDALNCALIEGMRVPKPTLAEQQTIVAVANSMDDAIEQASQERDGLQLLKASAADALLTGRVRVPLGGDS